MKYFICSDIHGSESACKTALTFYNDLKCDKLLLLGDILYHGPRNDLPQGHNPKGVIALLNPLADKIIACRGNCEAEVDQMVLNFPILSETEQKSFPVFPQRLLRSLVVKVLFPVLLAPIIAILKVS